MAFDSIEKKRKYQREWRRRKRAEGGEWHEREKATKRRYGHPEFDGVRGMETRAHINEQRWRFNMMYVARMQKHTREWLEQFTIVSQKELLCPEFIFVHGWKRSYENLHSPLPSW
jgi:hypothetical protein